MTKRRVVVTGLGIVCPLGQDLESVWQNILSGVSGISPIDHFDTSDFTTKFAGLVKDFDPTEYMQAKDVRKNDLFIQYGIAAGTRAMEDSGLIDANINYDKAGIIMGSGIGGLSMIEANTLLVNSVGPRKVSPFFIPGSIVNMTAGKLSIKYGFKGPNLAIATACTTGCHAIGMAARSIAYNDADVMIAGGSEKSSTPVGVAGFAAARALSTRNDSPEKASRPWDVDRDGFVLGDGAGAIILEEYEHAKKRGAKIYAELAGFGMSADAFHITRPVEGAVGGVKAMQYAIVDGKITPDKVNYVNAHGTSTPAGDVGESQAIEKVLGDASKDVLVSSTKSMTGHLLGAAGAIEAIFSVLALRDQVAPPTINLDKVDEGCNLDYVAHTAKEAKLEYCLSNSFGFGGTNGSLLFKKS